MLRLGRGAAVLLLGLLGAWRAVGVPWVDLPSDLPVDPTLKSGTLPNGLRYFILPNAEPKGRVSLRLLVSVGSLFERDDERGIAHFIEHMAFRGTTLYPDGSLIPTLERRGLGLGPDNTAFTSADYTVYHLELPDPSVESLRLGLTVFREYGSAVTFPTAAIEKERGVVLSELHSRDTPDQRMGHAYLWSLWPDSRYYVREPIGLETSIAAFTRTQLVSFYDAWYRPERMAVVIVGDVSPVVAEPLIAEILGPLKARGPARPEPSDVVPSSARAPDITVYVDDAIGGVRLSFAHPLRRDPTPDTHAERVKLLYRSLAFQMFEKRLDWATRRRGASLVAPSVSTESFVRGWQTVAFSASSSVGDWRTLAAQLEQEHRRAFLLGFTAEELALARQRAARVAEQLVRSAPTRTSPYLASTLESFLLYGGRLTTPAAYQHDLARDLEAATLQDCNRAFREAWTAQAPHVLVATTPAFKATREEVADALNASRSIKVAPPQPKAFVEFAYRNFGRPGKLAKESSADDLGVRLGRFENDVRLNFKATTFEADSVEVRVRIGLGQLSLPKRQPGLACFADYGFIRGGLRLHSDEELDAILSQHLLNINFHVGSDAFVFTARCARNELPLTLQLIAAYITDAGYHREAMRETAAAINTMYTSAESTPASAIAMEVTRVLTDHNLRLSTPEFAEVFPLGFQDLERWLTPQFRTGAIELDIVGDTTWSEASDAVARTLGALRKREPYEPPRDFDLAPFTAPSAFPKLIPLKYELHQVGIAWYWPMPDRHGIPKERRCDLLALVLQEMFFQRLRQELGATYTPTAGFVEYDGNPRFSYFALHADVQPSQGVAAAQAILHEINELLAHGIDEELFQRVRRPFLRAREEDLRTNSYWSETVLRDAQLRPERLAAARDRAADTASIQRSELEALARRYLDPKRGFLFIAAPGPTNTWGPAYMFDAK